MAFNFFKVSSQSVSVASVNFYHIMQNVIINFTCNYFTITVFTASFFSMKKVRKLDTLFLVSLYFEYFTLAIVQVIFSLLNCRKEV